MLPTIPVASLTVKADWTTQNVNCGIFAHFSDYEESATKAPETKLVVQRH
jgi:hypothetical protein